MDKIKRIVSSGRRHGEEYLERAGGGSRDKSRTSAPGKTAIENTQSTGNSGAASTTADYPKDTSAAGYTTSGYSNTGSAGAGRTSATYPQGTTAGANTTSGYGGTGGPAAGQAGTGYSTSSGYGSTGNTAAQSGTTRNTAVSSEGSRLSKGPNEGTSITSGLGSVPAAGSGNQYYEHGVPGGFQSSGPTGGGTGTSGAQTGNLTSRDNVGTGAGHQTASSDATPGRQLGRDAAVVGSAGAAAEATHLHRQNVKDSTSSGTGYGATSTDQRLGQDTVGSGTSGQGSHLHRQTGRENLGLEAGYTATSTDPISGNRMGRDTAVLGGTGAAGAGLYSSRENQSEALGSKALGSNLGHSGNTSTGASGAYSGPSGTAVPGPHATDAANLLDPAVAAAGAAIVGSGVGTADTAENERQKYESQSGARAGTTAVPTTGTGPTAGTYETTTGSSGPNLGRDVAAGAAGVGTTGLGAAGLGPGEHEQRKNEYETRSGAYGSGGDASGSQAGRAAAASTDLPGPAPHTAGPHRYDWMNKLDPRVDANPEMVKSSTADGRSNIAESDRHYGRDAAVGAGVGGVGGAAYGSTKKGHTKTDSGVAGISPTATTDPTASDPYTSKTTSTSEQKYGSQHSTAQQASGNKSSSATGYQDTATGKGSQYQSAADTSSSDRYGREAAAIGGGTAALGGAAALGEHEYQQPERSIPAAGKGAARDVDDRLQGVGSAGSTGATGTSGATRGTGVAGNTGASRSGSEPTSTLADRTTGGVGGVGQQRAASEDAYGSGAGSTKEYKGQQQYERDSAAAGNVGGGGGTSEPPYRKLSTGTPSGVSSDQLSGQYGKNISGPHNTMPGTFPEAAPGLDTYDSPISSTKGYDAGRVGAQEYSTTKHGPTTVATDEGGHTKLHKEQPEERLGSSGYRSLRS